MKKYLVTLGVIVAGAAVPAFAAPPQSPIYWELTGTTSPSGSLDASYSSPNLDAAAGYNQLSRTGLTYVPSSNSFNSNGWNTGAFDESTDYISFRVKPQDGYQITVTGLNYGIKGTNTAPGTGAWGYRVGTDSFILQPGFAIAEYFPWEEGTGSTAFWDITDFTTTSEVEFRFWAYGTTAVNYPAPAPYSWGEVQVANVQGIDLMVNGSVTAVPEPSVMALAAGGLGALVVALRRRKKQA